MSTPWNPNYKRKSKTYTSSEVKDRYNRKNYDQVSFRVGKGGREAIKVMAELRGMSLAGYIKHLVIADAQSAGKGDIQALLGGGGKLSTELKKQLQDFLNSESRT